MTQLEEQVFQRLLMRAKGSKLGRVATVPALKWLSDAFVDPIELRKALNGLRVDGKLAFSYGSRGEPVSAFITVLAPESAVPPQMLLWRSVVRALDVQEEEMNLLVPLGACLEGFDEIQMRDLLHCLYALRAGQDRAAGRPLLAVSAEYLLGSSKLMSSLDARSLRHFGIKVQEFSSRPSYLVVASAPSPAAVILVENPVAFEVAVESRASQVCTFVCTFGFGLSNVANEYGYQLASIVTSNRGTILHRTQGATTDLESLMAHSNLHFWGDLDQAGMQIFERIAQRVPHIRLSALYQPMLDAIQNSRRRHPYAAGTGKGGQVLYIPQREDARAVAQQCIHHAVDQEIVSRDQIEAFAGAVLSLP